MTVDSLQRRTWVPSEIAGNTYDEPTSIWNYRMLLVVAEDRVDDDWNDTAVTFSWWLAPGKR